MAERPSLGRSSQVHPGADAAGEDLLGPGQLRAGGEDLPQVGGVLQRARHVEAERRARPLHAGEQVQGGDRLLRADRQETLRQRTQRALAYLRRTIAPGGHFGSAAGMMFMEELEV